MPDPRQTSPRDWSDAIAALPPAAPPSDSWERLNARLPRKPQPRRKRVWLAIAASLLAIAVLPWIYMHAPSGAIPSPPPSAVATTDSTNADTQLQALHTESARLEAVLAQLQDDRMADGQSMALSTDIRAHIAGIDTLLSQPALDDAVQVQLWQHRVDALRQLAGVEGSYRWMAVNGAPSSEAQVY